MGVLFYAITQASQERHVQQLSLEVAQQQAANEALTAIIAKNSAEQQRLAHDADKHRLLSVDTLHAPLPSQGNPPRPNNENSHLNSKAAIQQKHAAARNVTSKDGVVKSPRKVRALK